MPRPRPSSPRVASPRARNTAAAIVTPSKVRVLGLRSTSMEIISSTMNAATATVAAEVVPASQRGFIHRRKFGCNVPELDVESRIASADPNAMDVLPVLASLDIAQAFPSFAR
eukprot:2740204-Pyramimonas_sp.AAC.1